MKTLCADISQVKTRRPPISMLQKTLLIWHPLRTGFDFFVHLQARSPKATLKFGDAGATTIRQGFDFIVHPRYEHVAFDRKLVGPHGRLYQ